MVLPQPGHVATHVVTEALNERGRAVRSASILVLGVTYKPDVNDIRKGARVAYADPFVPKLALESLKLDPVEPSAATLNPPTRFFMWLGPPSRRISAP